MNIRLFSLLAAALIGALNAGCSTTTASSAKNEKWISLFDGKTLNGWRASDDPGTFSVRNGAIVVKGPRSHLYYVGDVENHDFKNFALSLEVKTFPQANSGVYFHTVWQEADWPARGYEVQVNNSHSDPSRTAGLWGVKANPNVPVSDGEWFTLTIVVNGKKVTTLVNNKVITEYEEEENPPRQKGLEQRLISSGTFALQGHDSGSEVHFRNIRARLLP